MIKALVTDFFNTIEKKELKKNKNAKATFWVEQLQEVTAIDKNYISVKKATRLYNKYVEERENAIVKEPNKYLLDFMSRYLDYSDFEEYRSKKESTKEIIEEKVILKNTYKKSLSEKYKKTIIGISILITFMLLFFINKYNTNNSETCIIWLETHFEKRACKIKNTINNAVYNINLEKFKKIEVNKETHFFKNGKPQLWYGKSSSGKMEYFTHRGIHPETLKELNPITEYIINKYIFLKEEDKTILR